MKTREHLQFLAMMVPTFVLLGAVAFTLAFPTSSKGEPSSTVAVVLETEIGPLDTVVVQ